MIRALVRLGRTGRGAAITGFGRVTVGLCHRYSSLLLSSIYDMVRGEKCVPFTLPTAALAGATIISSLKPRPGAASFQRLPVLFLMCRLAKAVTKYPFPSGWISLSPGFAAVGAVRGFDVRGEDIVPAVLVLTQPTNHPETHFSLRSAEPVLPISLVPPSWKE